MQWFYPPGTKPSNFRERLAQSKIDYVSSILLFAPVSIAWTVSLALMDGLDQWGFYGLMPLFWMLFLPIMWPYQPAPEKPITLKTFAIWTAAIGAFIGFAAAWKSEAAWPLWIISIVACAAFETAIVVAGVFWIRSKNPYRRSANPD